MMEMQFSDFVTVGFNQIVNNLAKIHWRWGQQADVVVRMPTGGNVGAGPFHSQSTEAWFFHVPASKSCTLRHQRMPKAFCCGHSKIRIPCCSSSTSTSIGHSAVPSKKHRTRSKLGSTRRPRRHRGDHRNYGLGCSGQRPLQPRLELPSKSSTCAPSSLGMKRPCFKRAQDQPCAGAARGHVDGRHWGRTELAHSRGVLDGFGCPREASGWIGYRLPVCRSVGGAIPRIAQAPRCPARLADSVTTR